jgi:hypothetical protein
MASPAAFAARHVVIGAARIDDASAHELCVRFVRVPNERTHEVVAPTRTGTGNHPRFDATSAAYELLGEQRADRKLPMVGILGIDARTFRQMQPAPFRFPVAEQRIRGFVRHEVCRHLLLGEVGVEPDRGKIEIGPLEASGVEVPRCTRRRGRLRVGAAIGQRVVKRGELTRVLPRHGVRGGGTFLVWPSHRHMPAPMRAVRDLLLEELTKLAR